MDFVVRAVDGFSEVQSIRVLRSSEGAVGEVVGGGMGVVVSEEQSVRVLRSSEGAVGAYLEIEGSLRLLAAAWASLWARSSRFES